MGTVHKLHTDHATNIYTLTVTQDRWRSFSRCRWVMLRYHDDDDNVGACSSRIVLLWLNLENNVGP